MENISPIFLTSLCSSPFPLALTPCGISRLTTFVKKTYKMCSMTTFCCLEKTSVLCLCDGGLQDSSEQVRASSTVVTEMLVNKRLI